VSREFKKIFGSPGLNPVVQQPFSEFKTVRLAALMRAPTEAIMNAIIKAGHSILAIALFAGASAALHAQTSTPVPDLSHKVQFETGDSYFQPGDSLTVESITGPTDTITPGNVYLVIGTYKLSSQASAELSSNVTSKSPSGPTRNHDAATEPRNIPVQQGEGRFSVYLHMESSGFPHISLYPIGGGESFAGIYFGTGDSLMKPQSHAPSASIRTDSTSPKVDTSHNLHFEIGDTSLLDGDSLTIDSIRGPTDTILPGNIYVVKGTYKLNSHPNAVLSSNVTSDKNSAPRIKTQHVRTNTTISQGEGNFTVYLNMDTNGYPHISFYPSEGGSSFDSIYFGTGESLMKPQNHAANKPSVTDMVNR
jgi:hypothetical protein